jgi:aspartate racemase
VYHGPVLSAEKTPGIVGGIGPESTIEYYRSLLAQFRARVPDRYPQVLINSIDLTRMLGLIAAGRLDAVAEYLAAEVARLAQAGADFAVFASNTPHIVFEEVSRRAPIPMLSIVEAARDAALALGRQRVGLFGTRFTMEGAFYPTVFATRGIAVVVPSAADRAYIHDKYLGELVSGVIRPETRAGLLAVARRLREEQGVDAIVLGGTELPLILREPLSPEVPFLDTTAIHVKRIVDEMFSVPSQD